MYKVFIAGGGILVMALVGGCSSSPEDQTMQEFLGVLREAAAGLEKSKPADPAAADKLLKPFEPKIKELTARMQGWPKEKRDAMGKKYKAEIEALQARLTKAAGMDPDALADEQVRLAHEIAVEYEKVTDAGSLKQAVGNTKAKLDRFMQIDRTTQALPPEQLVPFLQKHSNTLLAAQVRLNLAINTAKGKAGGR